jgi:hypothetical protein
MHDSYVFDTVSWSRISLLQLEWRGPMDAAASESRLRMGFTNGSVLETGTSGKASRSVVETTDDRTG